MLEALGLDASEGELLSGLKKYWAMDERKPLVVLAWVPENNQKKFSFANKLHHPERKVSLKYPLYNGKDPRQTIFIPDRFENVKGNWVLATCELSPYAQRKKNGNPFALTAVDVEPLIERPDWLPPEGIPGGAFCTIPEGQEELLRSRYVSFLQKRFAEETQAYARKLASLKHEHELQVEGVRRELDQHKAAIKWEIEQEKDNLNRMRVQSDEEKSAIERLQYNKKELEQSCRTLQNEAEEEKRKMKKLKKFIENSARRLLAYDLIEKEDARELLPEEREGEAPVGCSFLEDLDGNYKQLVDFVQKYTHERGFYYTKEFIRDFLALIRTNDLIVLAGDSGSGKSSVCRLMAEALGGECIVVPVKPNWTSNEDLMGYYNPIDKKYLSTPFLEALLKASENPERLHLICLDEMNIARVEYYFADFLSLLEERSESPVFSLFSSGDAKGLQSEVSNFVALADYTVKELGLTDDVSFIDLLKNDDFRNRFRMMCGLGESQSLLQYHAQLKSRLNNSLCVPSEVTFPENVRIVGTVNVDDTTHYLAPKVLDRVNVIKFYPLSLAEQEEIDKECASYEGVDASKPVLLGIDELGLRRPYPLIEQNDALVRNLDDLRRQFFVPLGIEFGFRAVRQALCYRDQMRMIHDAPDVEEEVLDNVVLHKVLPKMVLNGKKMMSVVEGDEQRVEVLEKVLELKEKLQQLMKSHAVYSRSLKELERMCERAKDNDGRINYWLK